MKLTEARNLIRDIDRQIDAGRAHRQPDHHERECALFRRRGEAQALCAELEAAAFKAAPLPRQRKCPACGGSGRAKAPAEQVA